MEQALKELSIAIYDFVPASILLYIFILEYLERDLHLSNLVAFDLILR